MSLQELEEELASRTLELCRIPSPIGQERPIADHVEGWARRHFPAAQVFRLSNSLVVGDVRSACPSIALIGHLDTVPVHPADSPARREGARIYGRGSSDMKGGVAVMMAVAEALRKDQLSCNLLLIFYEREEGPYRESGLGLLFDAVPVLKRVSFGIALEPTDGVIQVGCVGSLHATVRILGRSAHSARPWQGENAIHKAGPFLSELLRLPPREVSFDGFTFREVFSVTQVSAGRSRNVIPDQLELNLNYRFAPGKSVAQAEEDVRRLVGSRGEIEFVDRAPSGAVCTSNPLFQTLLSVTGLPSAAKQGWTDVARFSEWGVDAVNFGPGETAQAHQQNESAPVAPLALAFDKLSKFLRAANKSAGP